MAVQLTTGRNEASAFMMGCGMCGGGIKALRNMCVGCEQTHGAEDGGTIEVVVQDMGAVRTKKAKLQGV